jgi:hypothetical protein
MFYFSSSYRGVDYSYGLALSLFALSQGLGFVVLTAL